MNITLMRKPRTKLLEPNIYAIVLGCEERGTIATKAIIAYSLDEASEFCVKSIERQFPNTHWTLILHDKITLDEAYPQFFTLEEKQYDKSGIPCAVPNNE